MPTKREREYYRMGFRDGLKASYTEDYQVALGEADSPREARRAVRRTGLATDYFTPKPKKRKLSEWQRFVKANSKKPRFRYKSGRKKGMINLKALGVAYRKKKR